MLWCKETKIKLTRLSMVFCPKYPCHVMLIYIRFISSVNVGKIYHTLNIVLKKNAIITIHPHEGRWGKTWPEFLTNPYSSGTSLGDDVETLLCFDREYDEIIQVDLSRRVEVSPERTCGICWGHKEHPGWKFFVAILKRGRWEDYTQSFRDGLLDVKRTWLKFISCIGGIAQPNFYNYLRSKPALIGIHRKLCLCWTFGAQKVWYSWWKTWN